jgi:hypothetical protein
MKKFIFIFLSAAFILFLSSCVQAVPIAKEKKEIPKEANKNIPEILNITITENSYPTLGRNIYLSLATMGFYPNLNYYIEGDMEVKGNEIIVNIKSENGDIKTTKPKGFVLPSFGPATFGKTLTNLEGDFIVKVRYQGKEDKYKLKITKDYAQITEESSSFSKLAKEFTPVASAKPNGVSQGFGADIKEITINRFPQNMIKIWCTSNSENNNLCLQFYNDLDGLGLTKADSSNAYIKEWAVKEPTYVFYNYEGNLSDLTLILKKYLKSTSGNLNIRIESWTGENCWVSLKQQICNLK